MGSCLRSVALGLLILLATAPAVEAQFNVPHVGYVYPAGGRQGDTFQVTVGGQYLVNAAKAYVSGSGVQAEVVEAAKPLTGKEVNDLREKLDELRKKPKDQETFRQLAEIRKKLEEFRNRQMNPVLADKVTLRIRVAADAALGSRELRLATPNGLSNPLVFEIADLTEWRKPKAEESEPPRRKVPKEPGMPRRAAATRDMDIALPVTLNGQIPPGGVDRYRFTARRGQQLVAVVSARKLVPYLADAVPGWFQAAVAIYDSAGKELAYDDHHGFEPDPVLNCKIPKDGQYVLEIHDSLYRGRDDFVYRIALGELPFVTSIFPLGGVAGTQTSVELTGWNLPSYTLLVDARDKGPDLLYVSVARGKTISNQVPFAVDTLPERTEEEPNDGISGFQAIMVPMIINGRIERPGKWDVFRFQGKAGQQIVAEVDARKLDSPLDSVLKLTDSAGKQLAFNDDYADKGTGLSTHHADSLLTVTLPAAGTYCLYLGDAQHKGGPEYGYRLRVSEPRPDFALRVVPSAINVHPGGTVPILVYALRKDGFTGDIGLSVKDLPHGFKASGARIPARQDQVRLTLTGPTEPLDDPLSFHIEGRATIQGQTVAHRAIAAEDMMQAFIYHHLVPMQDLWVMVDERRAFRFSCKFLGTKPVKLAAGQTVPLRFAVTHGPLLDNIQLTLSDPPPGIALEKVSPQGDEMTLFLRVDAKKVKPDQNGNLIVEASTERAIMSKNGKPQTTKRRTILGTLPAIPFEIVAPPTANQ
jgi:hypothetical protein